MKQTTIHDFVEKPKKPSKFTKPFKTNVRPNKSSTRSSSGSSDIHRNKNT